MRKDPASFPWLSALSISLYPSHTLGCLIH